MKLINVPTDQMGKFEGKWVAIDPEIDKIIAVGDTLEEIGPLVSGKKGEEKSEKNGQKNLGVIFKMAHEK